MDATAVWAIVKLLLPALAPVIVALLKKFGPQLIDSAPPWAKIGLSLLISIVIALLSGGTDVASMVQAATIGMAAIKVRDVATGKTLV